MISYDWCKYNVREEATHYCEKCGAGLCKICGYTLGGVELCNECYNATQEDHYYENRGVIL